MSFASRAASTPRICSHQKGRKKWRYAMLMVLAGVFAEVIAICTT